MPSLDQLHRLLAASPEDPFVPYAIAQEHAKAGAHGAAVEWFDKCLALDPLYCYAYFHKARAQAAGGDAGGAAATIEAGRQAARKAGDGHAMSELDGLAMDLEAGL